jgi:uncharacterized protein (DUF1800 family)
MLAQNETFRRHAFGSFDQLVRDVTTDGAMIVWLNQDQNAKGRPNENYARELMELFTLGADRGAYTETDVRELARALTGWRSSWSSELLYHNFRFDPNRHDTGVKTVFGQAGNWNWEDAVRLCVGHPMHPSFFLDKLWRYFIATPPSASDRQALEALYVSSGYQVRPVLEAILLHPDLHQGQRMVKAAGRLPRRPVSQAAAHGRPRGADLAVGRCGPAALLLVRRGGLGRHALARHDDRQGTLGAGAALL